MTGATWPTKDDDPSPVAEKQPPQSQQLSHSLSDSEEVQCLERSDDEPAMFVPLRLILVPSEQEKSRYPQNTPPSPRHYPDMRGSTNMAKQLENRKEQFNLKEVLPLSKDHQPENSKPSNDPQWADQDFSKSLYLARSLPSPPESPQTRRKQRHQHQRQTNEDLWHDSEEEALDEKKNEELETQEDLESFEY